MKCGMNGLRAIVVAILAAALFSVLSPASAQESEWEVAPSASVGVACVFDEASDTSTCEFAPVDEGGGAVLGLTIPAENLCAPVVSAGAGSLTGDGIYAALTDGFGSVSVTFTGAVSAGGSAAYGVDTDGGQLLIDGDGIVCSGAASTGPDVTTDVPPDTVGVDATPQPSDESESLDEGTDQGTIEEIPGEGGATTEDVPANDVVPASDVTVAVRAFDCDVDPNGADPASLPNDCSPSVGVEMSATANGADEGTATTDGDGWALFNVPDGSALVVVENTSTIPGGYQPYGNGVANVTAEEDGYVLFVHLIEPIVGRLQIVNGSCPTSGESRTEFRVIEPRSAVSAADAPECEATGGTVFTVEGGTLGVDGMTVVTGDDGAWRGFLPAGTYTVIDDSTTSADVTVIVDDISVVVVVDYISHPIGVLNVSRFTCDVAEQESIEIGFFGTEPAVGDDDGCKSADGDITIDVKSEVSAASVTTINLGNDGVEDIELEPGDYVLTDDASGETASFTIEGGTRLFAVVRDLVVGGNDVGNPGGGGPGGEDPGGNPSPGDGTGNPAPGEPDDGGNVTDGGVDTGENGSGGDGVSNVAQLPSTGVRNGDRDAQSMLVVLLGLSGGLAAGAMALKRARRAA